MTPKHSSALRPCPLCGSDKKERYIDGRFGLENITPINDPSSAEFAWLKAHWGDEGKAAPRFPYAKCTGCEMIYAEVFPNDATLGALYAGLADNMEMIDESARSKTQLGYAHPLKSGVPSGGRYLEIGPDIGMFVHELKSIATLNQSNFTGYSFVEPNTAAHQALNDLPVNKPISISSDLSVDNVEGPFSMAILIHVLDHLAKPQEMLEGIAQKMLPDGKIMIVTHNQHSLIARLMGKFWPAYHAQHPQLYNKKTLKTALVSAGFGNVKIKSTRNHINLGGLLQMIGEVVGLRNLRFGILGKIQIAIPLGNILAIAQRER